MSHESNSSSHTPAVDQLIQMIMGGMVQQCLHVVSKLGIPDLLQAGPKSSDELAVMTDTHAPSLNRVLRAMASVGVFAEVNEQTFALGPLGIYLQSNHPGSLRGPAIMFGESFHREAWNQLMVSVKTGRSAFHAVHGMGAFEYFEKHPTAAEIFNQAMTSFSSTQISIVRAYDFSVFDRIIDVGGGHGEFLTAILKENGNVKGFVYDLASVVKGTTEHIKEAGLHDRCQCIAGNFFESVPSGGDAYIMKSIIHDWSDEEAITILNNCRKAIAASGKLLLAETVLPAGNDPHPSKFVDLEMLVMTTGKERTESEFRALLKQAGFRLNRIIPTGTPVSIIEGIPE